MLLRTFPVSVFMYFLFALITAGCNKSGKDDTVIPDFNIKPGAFKVTLEYRNSTSATINWNQPVDPDNDTLVYTIILENNKLDTAVLKTTYTINNLVAEKMYKGIVIAVDPSGDTSMASFILPPFKGYMLVGTTSGSTPLNYVDLSSAKTIWSYSASGQVFNMPTIAGDTIFTNSGPLNVHALSLKSGTPYWIKALPGNPPVGYRGTSALAYEAGILVLSRGDDVIAVSGKDGSSLWKYEIISPIQNQPTIVNGIVYVGNNDGILYALEARSGKLKWQFDTRTRIESYPSVSNNTVVFASSTRLYALNATTGAYRWSYEATGKSARIVDGVVYVPLERYAMALDIVSGAVKWKTALDFSYSNPAVDAKQVYYFVNDIFVPGVTKAMALDRTTGKVLWETPTSVSVNQDPIVANNKLYIATTIYSHCTFDITTGKLIEEFNRHAVEWNSNVVLHINDSIFYPAKSGMLQ